MKKIESWTHCVVKFNFRRIVSILRHIFVLSSRLKVCIGLHSSVGSGKIVEISGTKMATALTFWQLISQLIGRFHQPNCWTHQVSTSRIGGQSAEPQFTNATCPNRFPCPHDKRNISQMFLIKFSTFKKCFSSTRRHLWTLSNTKLLFNTIKVKRLKLKSIKIKLKELK